jgi:hypothetical protein
MFGISELPVESPAPKNEFEMAPKKFSVLKTFNKVVIVTNY